MTKLELLSDCQAELASGGNGLLVFPSLTSKNSSMEINNLISQQNIGSAWASSATATGGTGGLFPSLIGIPIGGASKATATNTQKNYNSVTNFGFSFNV
jgi:hypothetical protein